MLKQILLLALAQAVSCQTYFVHPGPTGQPLVDGPPGTNKIGEPWRGEYLAGDLYFVDRSNNAIRKMAIGSGNITTIAGGKQGYASGACHLAQFDNPIALALDGTTVIYVADCNNNMIRKITTNGCGGCQVTDVVKSTGCPHGIRFDKLGNLVWVEWDGGRRVMRRTPNGTVTELGTSTRLRLTDIVVTDSNEYLVVEALHGGSRLRLISDKLGYSANSSSVWSSTDIKVFEGANSAYALHRQGNSLYIAGFEGSELLEFELVKSSFPVATPKRYDVPHGSVGITNGPWGAVYILSKSKGISHFDSRLLS